MAMKNEMTRSLVLMWTAVMLFSAAALAQRGDPARIKINNTVGLDSTYAQVVKLLGKPRKESSPKREECTGGREKTANYDGLTFYFMDGTKPAPRGRGAREFLVMSFNVTSPRVIVSGVKLGDSEAVVRRRYGKPHSVDTDSATPETTWTYEIGENQGPGQTSVTFRNGKVIAIGSSYTVC